MIHPNAAQESERLENQSTVIEPFKLTVEDVGALTAVDGAVLVDPMGTCYAFGVILDGMATVNGDRSRGARFNSSVRYVESQLRIGTPCVSIIVSEDGDICWLPQIRPQLSKRVLKEHTQDLKDLLASDDVGSPKCYRILNWMQRHAFYLPEETCLQVNKLVGRVYEYETKEGAWLKTSFNLAPDPLMDESYLTD